MSIRSLFYFAFDALITLIIRVNPRISLSSNTRFKGIPVIDIGSKNKLFLGSNVVINSRNYNYHLNMHSRSKIFIEGIGSKISIGSNSRVHGSCLHARGEIKIGKNCLVAANCQIIDSNGHDASFNDVANRINTRGATKPIIIEDNVWVGANSIILPGVTIGEGAIISANSVVKTNIPAMTLVEGNPAKVIYSAVERGQSGVFN